MDQNAKMLQSIYKSAEIGRDILGRLIRLCDDIEFRQVMSELFAEYHRILTECERLMYNSGIVPKAATQLERLPVYSSLTVNVRIDKTSSHLAEMLMQGSLMSYIDMAKEMRACPEAFEETKNLAWRLMSTEENNLQRLKQYL